MSNNSDIYQKTKDFTSLTIVFIISVICAIFCFVIYFKYPEASLVLKVIFWILFLSLFSAGGVASINLFLTGLDSKSPFFSIFGLVTTIAYIAVLIMFLTVAL